MASIRTILAAIETTPGTDAMPTAAANAILTRNLDITPLEVDEIDRDLDTDQVGNTLVELTNRRVSCSFEVELAGAGAMPETPPAFGVLLRGCAFAETVNATTDVTYALINDLDTAETLTIYVFWLGKLHKILGSRGSVSLNAPSRDLPRMSFNFTGLFVPVEEQAPDAADFSAFQKPLEIGNANTAFSLGGTALVMESLEIDLATPVNFITRVGRQAVELGNPEPSGTLVIETPALATKDFFADAGGAGVTLTLTNGASAGQVAEVQLDEVQTLQPTYTDLDDEGDGLSVPLRPIGNGIRIVTR